jgi:hypothetical protein
MGQRPQESPIGEALGWAARIIAIGLTMFLPGVAGSWLDGRLGTPWLGPVGLAVGFIVALTILARLRGGSGRRAR